MPVSPAELGCIRLSRQGGQFYGAASTVLGSAFTDDFMLAVIYGQPAAQVFAIRGVGLEGQSLRHALYPGSALGRKCYLGMWLLSLYLMVAA